MVLFRVESHRLEGNGDHLPAEPIGPRLDKDCEIDPAVLIHHKLLDPSQKLSLRVKDQASDDVPNLIRSIVTSCGRLRCKNGACDKNETDE